ncbi:histidyl-tRNA synthetase, partial [mine drainage metagenome]
LGLEGLTLELNSLGTAQERVHYRAALAAYLASHEDALGPEDRVRLARNPLRLLDSKSPETRELLTQAPELSDSLGAASREHWQRVRTLLDAAGIAYRVNPRLVRGLDYYTQTVFEWTSTALGAQSAVCSGGRYDGLVEQLGGPPTPAMGWALGLERLAALVERTAVERPCAVLVTLGPAAEESGFALLREIRRSHPGLRVVLAAGPGPLKAKLKRADRLRARWALILGDDELAKDVVQVKALEGPARVEWVSRAAAVAHLAQVANQ